MWISRKSAKETAREAVADRGIEAVVVAGLTILASIVLSELQVTVGWLTLSVGLLFVLANFVLIAAVVQRPMIRWAESMANEVAKSVRTWPSWLLETDELARYELESKAKEIWLVTADLLDDVEGAPFAQVVKDMLGKGVKYVYFCLNTSSNRTRAKMIRQYHDDIELISFIFLNEQMLIVPGLDVVIYDPLQVSNGRRGSFMGLPIESEAAHFHAEMSGEFVDNLVGKLLPVLHLAE